MTDTSQHAAHLDAEQLAAFAEGALPEHERLLVLRHTAECARCREIAFLAQEPALVEVPVQEPAPWWRAWSNSWVWGGAGAFAASVLLLGVFLWKRSEPAVIHTPTVALNREQVPLTRPFPAAAHPPSARPEKAAASPGASDKAVAPPPVAVPMERSQLALPMGQAFAAPPAAPLLSPTGGATTMAPRPAGVPHGELLPLTGAGQNKAAPMRSPDPLAAPVPPAIAAEAASDTVDAMRLEQLPVKGRSTAAPFAAKMRAAASEPLRLQIEHGSGSQDGKAQLSGIVLDLSGATIPGATVTLLGPASGVRAKTVTDVRGQFALSSLPAGQYQAQFTAPGFVTVTQSLDLQSRDIARAETVLPVGAMSEAVEVSAASAEIAMANSPLSTVELRDSKRLRKMDALPGGRATVTTVSVGDRVVALDTAGSLFARREGKHWKRVEPQWPDAVKTLSSATPDVAEKDSQKAGQEVFQITTSAGTVWSSTDGEHWTRV